MSTCQPFAIMRLTHEAIRVGLNEIQSLINSNSTLTISHSLKDLNGIYNDVKRVIELHAKQENEVFYNALEAKQKGVSLAFVDEHESEEETFTKIEVAFENATISNDALLNLIDQLNMWAEDHEHHLKHEEGVLMEILPKHFTYVEAVNVVRDILNCDINEFENFQLNWIYSRLKKPQQEVYLGMLKGCSPEGKFEDFMLKVEPKSLELI